MLTDRKKNTEIRHLVARVPRDPGAHGLRVVSLRAPLAQLVPEPRALPGTLQHGGQHDPLGRGCRLLVPIEHAVVARAFPVPERAPRRNRHHRQRRQHALRRRVVRLDRGPGPPVPGRGPHPEHLHPRRQRLPLLCRRVRGELPPMCHAPSRKNRLGLVRTWDVACA